MMSSRFETWIGGRYVLAGLVNPGSDFNGVTPVSFERYAQNSIEFRILKVSHFPFYIFSVYEGLNLPNLIFNIWLRITDILCA